MQDDQAVLEVPEQVEHAWFDSERSKPEGEDAGFAFAFGVNVLDRTIVFWLLVRTEPGVEEVGDKGKVSASGEGEVLVTADGGSISVAHCFSPASVPPARDHTGPRRGSRPRPLSSTAAYILVFP